MALDPIVTRNPTNQNQSINYTSTSNIVGIGSINPYIYLRSIQVHYIQITNENKYHLVNYQVIKPNFSLKTNSYNQLKVSYEPAVTTECRIQHEKRNGIRVGTVTRHAPHI